MSGAAVTRGTTGGRRSRVATAVAVVGLVGSLAGWGWFATEQARDGWWALGQHEAVEPDAEGWASIDTLSVRLTGVDTATELDEEQPPEGYHYLLLDFEVEAPEASETGSCEVQVRDTQGRLFLAGQEVPRADPYVSSLRCGTSDPAEDPVPTDQSVVVLVPVDATPESVRVDAREFPPATFIALPLPS